MRTINLNKEFYGYLIDEIKCNDNLNEVDKTIASYLLYLEQTRISRNENDKDYIYPSYQAITKATNIKARQTIVKSINKLLGMGIILRLIKGSVKDGANRYWMNQHYLSQDMATSTHQPVIEYCSNENNDNSQILKLLVEIQSELKSFRKENQELKNEIREMKEMMMESQTIVEDDVVKVEEEPQVEMAVKTPLMPSSEVECRAIDTIDANEINKETIDFGTYQFNCDEDDDYERELEEVLNIMANGGRKEPVVEPIEQSTINIPTQTATPKTFAEREKELDEKYNMFSYIYEKPFSKLYSEKELYNEIDFRTRYHKPLYDLHERLAEIRRRIA